MLFASRGLYDKNQIWNDCELHGMPFPFDDEHLNIKNHVATRLSRRPKGVGRTLAALGMTFEGTPHRWIDDVRNIIRIVKRVGLGELPAMIAASKEGELG